MPGVLGTIYVRVSPGHTLGLPPATVIVPGADGVLPEVTDKVIVESLPQLLLAVTEIVPDDPVFAVMELVVDVPFQSEGKVHV